MIRRLLALVAISLSITASAQTTDFGMWNTVSLNKELSDKFTVGLDQELRLRENCSTINLIYTNIGGSYKVTDWFKVGLTYRFIDKHKDDYTWGQRHRVYVDLTFKVKPAKFAIAYRARFQSEWYGNGYTQEFGNIPEVFMRNQVKVGYKASDKVEPYVGCEIRFQFENPRNHYPNTLDRGRYFAGVNYEINKHHIVGAYFLLQKEVNVNDPETLNILGLEYTLNL